MTYIEGSKFHRSELGKSLEISEASGHIEEVVNIAQETQINPEAATAEQTQSGFLVYALPHEGYEKRAQDNEFFITFSEQGEIKGFLMCYEKTFLEGLIQAGDIDHEDGIVAYLQTQTHSNANFLYGDQIGISAKNRTKEAGTILMEQIFDRMRKKGIADMYVAILHEPIRNEASLNFVGRLGFNSVSEVKNSDGLLWGIYHINISTEK